MSYNIFIGLGGTGTEIVRLIKDSYQSNSDATFIGIDRFDEEKKKDLFGIKLIDIALDDAEEILNRYYSEIKDWFPFKKGDFVASNLDTTSGFLQKRYLGALGFFASFGRVKSSLTNLKFNPNGEPIFAFVFSSAAGGAGSSFFVPMGYLLNKILESNFPNLNVYVIGVVLGEDIVYNCYPTNKDDTLRAGAGFWSEVSFWMRQEYNYKFSHPIGYDLNFVKERPYKAIFIFNYNNSKGLYMKDRDDYKKLVADYFLNYSRLRELKVRAQEGGGQQHVSLENHWGKLLTAFEHHAYSSGSVVRIYFPEEEVRQYIAEKFIKETLEYSLNEKFENSQIEKGVQSLLEELKILQTNNKNSLEGGFDNIVVEVYGENSPYLSEKNFRSILTNEMNKASKDEVGDIASKNTTKIKEIFSLSEDSEVNQKWSNYLESLKGSFEEKMNSLFVEYKSKGDIAEFERFLKKVKENLEKQKSDGLSYYDRYLNTFKLQDIRKQVNNSINDVKKISFVGLLFGKRKILISTLVSNMVKYYRWYRATIFYNTSKDFYNGLIKIVSENFMKRVESVKEEILDLKRKIIPTLPENADVIGQKNGYDFTLKICNARLIVDEKIYNTNRDKFIESYRGEVIDNLINLIDEKEKRVGTQFVDIKGELVKIIKDKFREDETFKQMNISKALDIESEYFAEKFIGEIQSLTGDELQEFLFGSTLGGKVTDYQKIYGEEAVEKAVEIIGSKIDNKVNEIIKIFKRKRVEKNVEDYIFPFWNFDKSNLDKDRGLNAMIFSVYNPKVVDSELQKVIADLINNLKSNIEGGEKYEVNNLESERENEIYFLSWQFSTPLSSLKKYSDKSSVYRKAEEKRLKYILEEKINPNLIGNTDKRVIETKFTFIEETEEDRREVFLLMIMAELLDIITPSEGEKKDYSARKNYKAKVQIMKSYPKGKTIANSNKDYYKVFITDNKFKEKVAEKVYKKLIKEREGNPNFVEELIEKGKALSNSIADKINSANDEELKKIYGEYLDILEENFRESVEDLIKNAYSNVI